MKVLFIGLDTNKLYEAAKLLQSVNDNLDIAPTFTTELSMKGHITENFIYYMPLKEVELAYKNNAFFWVCSNKHVSHGLTLNDYYRSDILVIDFYGISNISEPSLKMLMKDGVVVVHLDSKTEKHTKEDIIESKFALQRLEQCDMLYFCDDAPKVIVKTVIDYMNADNEKRIGIIESLK